MCCRLWYVLPAVVYDEESKRQGRRCWELAWRPIGLDSVAFPFTDGQIIIVEGGVDGTKDYMMEVISCRGLIDMVRHL
jgi:hypothetical protein